MPALRARRADARERSLARLGGRRLESAFEPAAPRRLDVRGRGRSPDLPRASALGGGGARRLRPRVRVHRTPTAPALHLPSAAFRQFFARPLAAADGLRMRLKASFDVRPFPRQARIVLVALKHYGMLLADNGSDWFISGAPSPVWSNDQLHTLGRVKGSDFEVVDTSHLRP